MNTQIQIKRTPKYPLYIGHKKIGLLYEVLNKAHTLFTVLYDKKFEISVRTNIYFGQNRIQISIFGGKYSNI